MCERLLLNQIVKGSLLVSINFLRVLALVEILSFLLIWFNTSCGTKSNLHCHNAYLAAIKNLFVQYIFLMNYYYESEVEQRKKVMKFLVSSCFIACDKVWGHVLNSTIKTVRSRLFLVLHSVFVVSINSACCRVFCHFACEFKLLSFFPYWAMVSLK